MKGRWLLGVVLAGLLALPAARVSGQESPPTTAPDAPGGEAEPPLGEEEAMVLNFERADIREVIHSLATALGISYTIDPRIEGQVTIRTTGKIAREDLFPLLNQILRNNGIAAVKVGEVYQILPVAEAKTRAIIPRDQATRQSARSTDSFVIEIIPVQHVAADEMVNILQPFVTPGGDVLSYPRSNLLVVTDLRSNVERLRELVATFDTNVFRDLRARVFKMKHGDPEELANEILGLLAPYGVSPTGEGEGGLYIVPLSRLNSMVVFAYDESTFGEIDRWLKMLDIPPEEGAGRQTFVYNVENAKAVDLAAVLNELFGGGPGAGGVAGAGRAPGAPPAGVGLFGAGGVSGGRAGAGGRLGGGRGGIGGGAQAGGALGQQAAGTPGAAAGAVGGSGRRLGGRGGAQGVGGAPGAPGAAGAQAARGVTLPGGTAAPPGTPGAAQGPPPVFKEEVRIVADEVTNSLVILATKRDFQLILDVLKRIDVVPRQVVLEVTIAEVVLNKDLSFGIRYALAEGKLTQSTPVVDESRSDSIFRNRPPGAPVGGLLGDASRVPLAGAFAVISDREHFQIFLNALQRRANVKMLSAPHIIAADNREAHILVGQSIPILTSTASNVLTAGTAATINAVQYRDTGKILTVLPQVNSKGLVNMQIRQEVSAVLAGAASFGSTGSPAFSTREAETTVVVQDGESVLIGGIIDDMVTHRRIGVPFLMDIPVIGIAFRSEDEVNERTELLVLITPYVIRNRDEARAVTETYTDRLQGMRRIGRMMRERPKPNKPPILAPESIEPVSPPEARERKRDANPDGGSIEVMPSEAAP